MLALLVCLTLADVKREQCAVACRWAGYTDGRYNAKLDACECIDLKEFGHVTKTQALYPPQAKRY
jgi:hypothetical protein